MTTKQHRIVTFNGNEYILFDLRPYGYENIFVLGTEDDVFHQAGYAAVKDGEVWREGEKVANLSDLGETGRFWSEPEEGLEAIWARHGLPTNKRGEAPDLPDIDAMTNEEALVELQRIIDEVLGPQDLDVAR